MFRNFKKKTAEEILELFKNLPEEEQKKFLSALGSPKTEDEAQIDEAKENIESRGEEDGTEDQSEKDLVDESVGEQERLDGDEDSQTAKDRIDESEGAEASDEAKEEEKESDEPEVKDDGEERYRALVARIEALEATLGNMRTAQEEAVEEEKDRDFGMSPSFSEGDEDESRYSRVMRGYAKNNYNQYK